MTEYRLSIIFREPEDSRVQRKNAGGRKLQKQQMKHRKRENAKKQLAKTPREKASGTEKKNKNK